MRKLEFTVHCPVCKMTKVDRSLLFNYRGIDHYFCSSQCLDRFKAHPHLFVGDPKHGMSPKQKGQTALKKCRIGFAEPIDDELKVVMQQSLLSLMGIESLVFEESLL